MQHSSRKHVIDGIRSVFFGKRFERRSKPIIQISGGDAILLQRYSHDLLRKKVGRLRQRLDTFDKAILPKTCDTQSKQQLGFACRYEEKIAGGAGPAAAPPHPLEKAGN
jgi:hypothetical protein